MFVKQVLSSYKVSEDDVFLVFDAAFLLECVRSHVYIPYKLIRNQKNSITNAERLKSKYNETNINNAPQKFMILKLSE